MTAQSVLFVNLRRIPREGLESLLAARRLGYRVVLMGATPPNFARILLDEHYPIDTYDRRISVELARTIAREHDIAGVANFTELDVQLVADITTDLGLPGMSAAAALQARNKYAMKLALRHLRGLLPRFARVRSLDELRAAVVDIGLPAVIKPSGASGSKGIFELRAPADLEAAIGHLTEFARPEVDPVFRQFGAEFIVEEFIEGDEISVEGLVVTGNAHLVTVTDKLTSTPYHLELQHALPSRLPAELIAEVGACTKDVVAALGLDNCAFHLELKCDDGRLRFIEIAARPAGDYIASHLIPLATGIDFFENVIRAAVGEPLRLEPNRQLHAGVRFVLAEQPGRFEGLGGVEGMFAEPGYDHLFIEHPVGTRIALPPKQFVLQRVAAICARHADRDSLDELLERAGRDVTVQITP